MLLILMKIFEPNSSVQIKQICNETLLIVLLDEDQSIRVMAQNFWCEKANMPSYTIERLVTILDKCTQLKHSKNILAIPLIAA